MAQQVVDKHGARAVELGRAAMEAAHVGHDQGARGTSEQPLGVEPRAEVVRVEGRRRAVRLALGLRRS